MRDDLYVIRESFDRHLKGARRRGKFDVIDHDGVRERPDSRNHDPEAVRRTLPQKNSDDHAPCKINLRRGLMRMMLGPEPDPLMIIFHHDLS